MPCPSSVTHAESRSWRRSSWTSMLMFSLSAAALFSAISSRCRAISLIPLFLDFLEDLRELIGSQASLHFVVDDDDGCLAASTYAAALFQSDLSIGCGLTQFDVQHLFCFFNQLGHPCHVTGRSQTKFDRVLAARLCFEKRVE